MRVLGAKEPREARVRAAVDGLADELDTEPSAAVFREDVDIRQIRECFAVGNDPREADLQ